MRTLTVLLTAIIVVLVGYIAWDKIPVKVVSPSIPVHTGVLLSGAISSGMTESSGVLMNSGITLSGILSTTGALIISGTTASGRAQSAISNTGKTFITDSCIGEICIDRKRPIVTEKDGTLIQAYNTEFHTDGSVKGDLYVTKYDPKALYTGIIKINFRTQKALKIQSDGYESELRIEKGVGNFFVRRENPGGCISSFHQSLLSLDGKPFDIRSAGLRLPENFRIGNIGYTLSGANTRTTSSLDVGTPIIAKEFTGALSLYDDIGKQIYGQVLKEKFLAQQYIVEFREIPGVKVLYTSSFEPSDVVVTLGTDASWIAKNIQNGDLMDIEVTKKILGYFPGNWGRSVFPRGEQVDYNKQINSGSVVASQLPIFRVVAIDTLGHYSVYPSSRYTIEAMAELCKPLVYIYDSSNLANTLSVTLPQGGYFSKLIPHFTLGNSWQFHADTLGNIYENNTNYEYLYYSAKVPSYVWNQDGWQVQGSDILTFFHDKLPKTGMNAREQADFIKFWKDEFHPEKTYFVSFKFNNEIDSYARLTFARSPDAEHRVLLEAYPISRDMQNLRYRWPDVGNRFDTKLLKTFTRTGKMDVFEWGGVVFHEETGEYRIK